MTGIAIGGLDFPKIGLGSTEILKVSLGDVLVWPATVTNLEWHNNGGVITQDHNFSYLTPVDGDLLFYCRWLKSSNAIADFTPANWTKISSKTYSGSNQYLLSFFYCIYSAALHGTTISAPTANGFYSQGIIVLNGKNAAGVATPITTVQVVQGAAQLGTSLPAAMNYNQNTGLGGTDSAFIAIYCADADIHTLPTFTGAVPLETPLTTLLPTRLYTGNAALANITIGLPSDGGGNISGMQYVQFKVT